ncbi:glycine receptor subunit beta-like isoform X3 [Tigriopus californicus]|uniref:glycine receptor subunit beta-like isoform X3 n=1 Tax=Tigriopus californicus TaxID=6832 RepID=UPI0027DA491A|nr:glycine receptor subunit beta-like isoform X3 [Tigriopus californicus]
MSYSLHFCNHKMTLGSALGVISVLIFGMGLVEGVKAKNFQCDAVNQTSLPCLPVDYSKFELPMPTDINKISISAYIDEVMHVKEDDYSITFSCYLNVKWSDPRIHLDRDFGKEQAGVGGKGSERQTILVPVTLEMVDELWLPNVFIYNMKEFKVTNVLNKQAGLWIGTDKSILYSQAVHITFMCPMNFARFPLDTQVCKFQLGSYSYSDLKMMFETEMAGYSPPKHTNSIPLDFEINISKLSLADQTYIAGSLGNFSLAGFELVLDRHMASYLLGYYLPTGLFVMASWIGFLIPVEAIPGRMALLITLFLVLMNIFNTITTITPKTDGLTAIQVWILACIVFVFGALVEFKSVQNELVWC